VNPIVEFYRGTTTDFLGRRLSDLWAWDHERLEGVHDYIQVLFPNCDPSFFNFHAPLLDEEAVAAFCTDPLLRENLARSLDLMLRFYGLEHDRATGQIVRRPEFEERAQNWLNRRNHNYLRITRILLCLHELGLDDLGRAFLAALEAIYLERPDQIGTLTMDYWRDAARGVSRA
jgi:hypothetical protein